MAEALDIKEFHQVNSLVSWLYQGTGDRLVVVFSGIGKDHQDVQPYEFAQSATGGGAHSVLYISDTARSWLNRAGIIDDIQALVKKAKAQTGASKVATLGHSMGGFSAAVMAKPLGADNAICLSPQNSVHPEIAGDDPRWQAFRDSIAAFDIRGVEEHLDDVPVYTVLFGRHGRETPQRDRFPIRDNVDFFVMKNTVHNTPMRLKQAGLLDTFITAAANGRRRKVRQMMFEQFSVRPLRDRVPIPPSDSFAPPPANAAE
ncbi:MAG: alpha/beta hydrolase [Pseudomonadota bacterium]